MYSSYYNIGTSGHRVAPSYGFVPNQAYPHMYQPAMIPPPPAYFQPHLCAPQMPAQQEVAGGISAVLEYEPPTMAAFMCWCVYGMLNQSRTAPKEFEASVSAILNATRLPKSTILVALEYTNQRFVNASPKTLSDQNIYTIMVISLVLANKFNDDNTFTNKSWSSASAIEVPVLNREEAIWLAAVNWKLNVVKFLPEIETLDECWKTWLKKYTLVPPQPGLSSAYPTSPSSQRYYGSIPSSPAYASDSSVYEYSSSTASPIRYNDWAPPAVSHYQYSAQPNPYAQYQPSIWSFEPKQGPPPAQSFYGYANPYYNNCLTSC